MTLSTQELIKSFELLPDVEKHIVITEILRRTKYFELPSFTDEELVLVAEDVFLELDRRESQNGESTAQ